MPCISHTKERNTEGHDHDDVVRDKACEAQAFLRVVSMVMLKLNLTLTVRPNLYPDAGLLSFRRPRR